MTQYPPRHITTTLNVSDSTVRRWSEVFARHLSPFATVAPRRYTEQDVAALVAQIAVLNERVTRLERAAHRHTGMVKGTPID